MNLSRTQRRILAHLQRYQEEHGVQPRQAETARELGISKAHVSNSLNRMAKAGIITRSLIGRDASGFSFGRTEVHVAGFEDPHGLTAISSELFACEPYRCRMSRRACAANYIASNERKERPLRVHCRGCEIGKAHADGERPVEGVEVSREV